MAWAKRVTVRRLAEDVERMLLLQAGNPLAWQRCELHPARYRSGDIAVPDFLTADAGVCIRGRFLRMI